MKLQFSYKTSQKESLIRYISESEMKVSCTVYVLVMLLYYPVLTRTSRHIAISVMELCTKLCVIFCLYVCTRVTYINVNKLALLCHSCVNRQEMKEF